MAAGSETLPFGIVPDEEWEYDGSIVSVAEIMRIKVNYSARRTRAVEPRGLGKLRFHVVVRGMSMVALSILVSIRRHNSYPLSPGMRIVIHALHAADALDRQLLRALVRLASGRLSHRKLRVTAYDLV